MTGVEGQGVCPNCEAEGAVGAPCQERPCKVRGYHVIPAAYVPDEDARARGVFRPDPLVGRMIGKYLVVHILGSGGFGTVYLTLQQPIGMKAALKRMHQQGDTELGITLVSKFESEARALATLHHPNIVRLHDYGSHEDAPYLVMEYIEGGRTLKGEINRRAEEGRAWSLAELRHILGQLADGLEAAHALDIVHRDVKPENIMLQEVAGNPDMVRILDFGLAKYVAETSMTENAIGTPAYLAPEQLGKRNIGPWTDVYAMAVIAYEMLMGFRPFRGETQQEVLGKKIDPDYDPFEGVEAGQVSPELSTFLTNCLMREVSMRPQSAAAFRQGLMGALDTVEQMPTARTPRDTVAPPPVDLFGVKERELGARKVRDDDATKTGGGFLSAFPSEPSPAADQDGEGEGVAPGPGRQAPIDAPELQLATLDVGGPPDPSPEDESEEITPPEIVIDLGDGAESQPSEAAPGALAAPLPISAPRPSGAELASEILASAAGVKAGARAASEPVKAMAPLDSERGDAPVAGRPLPPLLSPARPREAPGTPTPRRAAVVEPPRARRGRRMVLGALFVFGLLVFALFVFRDHAALRGFFGTAMNKTDEALDGLKAAGRNVAAMAAAAVDEPAGWKLVRAGEFTMGSPRSEADRDEDEGPQRTVILKRPFLMSIREVSRRDWKALMEKTPAGPEGCPDCPVTSVNWWEALAYCNALSARDGLAMCYQFEGLRGTPGEGMRAKAVRLTGVDCSGYRLPTEAEWEYAARAELSAPLYGRLNEVAWSKDTSGDRLRPVGDLLASPWGFRDIYGNAWEWVWDIYATTYDANATTDPTGPTGGSRRVKRGGAYDSDAASLRAANRASDTPETRKQNTGFRVVRAL